ncbi:hypothetical protein M5K25_023467 [Dendrobium thyrsiflorum]|uniref:Ubiquitin-like protease family profile domain-containing protein n=1 Tax=Dendrobium thyrsiflorum TaxID=117978 RepID=A0ABD0UF63_DENTH
MVPSGIALVPSGTAMVPSDITVIPSCTAMLSYKFSQIDHFFKETQHSFDEDIHLWPVRPVVGVPVQSNNMDCGMFVCKYMEAAVQPEPVVWADQQHWAENMPKFRAELAYAIMCATIR